MQHDSNSDLPIANNKKIKEYEAPLQRIPHFTPPPTGDPVSWHTNIHLISWNMNGSFNERNRTVLRKLLEERKVDVLCLQRISKVHKDKYNEMFKKNGYNYILLPPNSRKKGGRGLLIVYKHEMKNCIRKIQGGILQDHVHETDEDFVEGDFEWIAMDLYLRGQWHTIVNFYHGSQTNPKKECLQGVCAFLNGLCNESQNYLHLVGTMNQGQDKNNLKFIREQLAPHNASYILKNILPNDFVTYYGKIERKKTPKDEMPTISPDIVISKRSRHNTLASNCIIVISSFKPFGTKAKVYHKLINLKIGKDLSEADILKDQNFILNTYQKLMKNNEDARQEFCKFRDNVMKHLKQKEKKTKIDPNNTIMKAVNSMDAEMFFSMVSKTGSTIKFLKNDKTLNLLINNQLNIEIDQICLMSENNLKNMMILTKALMTAIEKKTERQVKLAAKKKELKDLKKSVDSPVAIAQAKEGIQAGEDEIKHLENNIHKEQNAILDIKKKLMESKTTQQEFCKFRNKAMNDREQRGNNVEIDQKDRVINAVTYMDADKVFSMISKTGSDIKFSNDKTLDLLINDQLEIHPRAIDQMNRKQSGKKDTDLENMMRLTKDYTKNPLGVKDYLREIKICLKPYEMITNVEIKNVYKMIESLTIEEPVRDHFKNMTPAEAYRMRTVLDGILVNGLELAFKMAEAYGDTSVWTIAAFVEIVKEEFKDFKENLPSPDSKERRTEYHEQLREWEIEGLVSMGGIIEEEARAIADENFHRREAIQIAREQRALGLITDDDMKRIAKENIVHKLYKQYHKKKFIDWETGGKRKISKDEKFTGPLLNDQEKFKAMMNEIRQGIEGIQTTTETGIPMIKTSPIVNPVYAYYHARKYRYFGNRLYISAIRYYMTDFIFKKRFKRDTFISQDAKFTSTIYNDGKSFSSVIKCAYNAGKGRRMGIIFNLSSFVIFPKSAAAILEKFKNYIQANHTTAINKKKSKIQSEQDNIAEIQQLEEEILKDQEKFLDNKEEWMENEGAREKFGEFRTNARKDPEQRGKNTKIDQNDRIMKAVTYMNADMFFSMVSLTDSKIKFSNDKTLKLLINDQLDIHPRTIHRMQTGNKITDLENFMRLTKGYTENSLEKEVYLIEIKKCLKSYKMITRAEIKEIYEILHKELTDLLAGSPYASGVDVLQAAFSLCRICHQTAIEPKSLFTTEERKEMDKQIIDAIPLINNDIETDINNLGLENATILRAIRSGLEFIKDDFGTSNAWLEWELKNMIDDEAVSTLDKKIASWRNERGEYGDDPVDLRGVPESHYWWSKLEQDDSKKVYGI